MFERIDVCSDLVRIVALSNLLFVFSFFAFFRSYRNIFLLDGFSCVCLRDFLYIYCVRLPLRELPLVFLLVY